MKIFDKNRLVELSQRSDALCLSIFIPTTRVSTDGYKQDKIHLKNQLAEAEKSLASKYDLSQEEIAKLLQPARALLDDQDFWKHNSDLLACYLCGGDMEIFQLPISMQESSHFISHKPFTLPLLPELADNGHYYLLLLNLDRIHLYEATRNVIQEVLLDPEEVAVSFTAEEEQFENQKHLQGQGSVGHGGTMYHSHGEGTDEEKKVTILQYFHRMTNMLEPILHKNPLPLYLAGVDYLIPLYREANKYPELMSAYVSGGFSSKDVDLLHEKSWELASSHFVQERKRLLESFDQRRSENTALADSVEAVLKACFTGAVDTLFVSEDHQHLWGRYDADKHAIIYDEDPKNGNHCLIDAAVSAVIRSKGKVFVTDGETTPGKRGVAALVRYPQAV